MARRVTRPALPDVLLVGRLSWGALLLLAPGRLLRPLGPVGGEAIVTLRVLGTRHLAQAALTSAWPTSRGFAAGATVDAVHALAALTLAAVDRRQRRAALANAAVATGWALLGATAARHRGEQ
ncbi:hypothetical protein ACFO0M_27220 [Micromonospora mangrovi]|uniref:Uncharacterized protein n=2 Tax=Micromonospora TaxID=1873 RepID=A0AAU8HLL0_9ACTN